MGRTEIVATVREGSAAMHLRFFADVNDRRHWECVCEDARRKLERAFSPIQGAIVGAPADPEAFD